MDCRAAQCASRTAVPRRGRWRFTSSLMVVFDKPTGPVVPSSCWLFCADSPPPPRTDRFVFERDSWSRVFWRDD